MSGPVSSQFSKQMYEFGGTSLRLVSRDCREWLGIFIATCCDAWGDLSELWKHQETDTVGADTWSKTQRRWARRLKWYHFWLSSLFCLSSDLTWNTSDPAWGVFLFSSVPAQDAGIVLPSCHSLLKASDLWRCPSQIWLVQWLSWPRFPWFSLVHQG